MSLGSRFFVGGPKSWGWKGRCEVLPNGNYIHHPDWPERATFEHYFFTSLEHEIRGLRWVEVFDDDEVEVDPCL